MRPTAVFLLAFLLAVGCRRQSDQRTPAHQLRDAAIAQARQENKQVFLLFVTSDCDLCDLFDRFHADPAVANILRPRFVEVKINVPSLPGSEQLYLETGNPRGAPAFSIMDSTGYIHADSGSLDQASNIGFPTTDEELDRYVEIMQAACPDLSADDLALLRAKLQEVRRDLELTQPPEPAAGENPIPTEPTAP